MEEGEASGNVLYYLKEAAEDAIEGKGYPEDTAGRMAMKGLEAAFEAMIQEGLRIYNERKKDDNQHTTTL